MKIWNVVKDWGLLPFLHHETIFKALKQIEVSHAHPDSCCPLFSVSAMILCSMLLCPQIRSRNPNEIIFGLNDGYYAADFDHKVWPTAHFSEHLHHNGTSTPNLISFIFNTVWLLLSNSDMWLFQDLSERKKNSLLQVDQSSVRNSYSVFSLLR